MAEKVRVGARGEIVLPEKLAENLTLNAVQFWKSRKQRKAYY